MAIGFRRAALCGAMLCVVVVTASASPASTSGPQPLLEMAMEAGEVNFGELCPTSPPRTLRDAVYIAVKTQTTGPWNLTVSATGDFAAGEGGPTFSIGNLEVAGRLNGQPAPFQRCSTSPVALVSNGPATGGIVATDYRLSVGYDAPVPANGMPYRSNLVFTTSFGMLAASYVEPNPFDPIIHRTVAIKYYYSRLAYPYVRVRISDPQGKAVRIRSFPRPPDGWYTETWDGRDREGHVVPDGLYSYSITASTYVVAGGYIKVQRSLRRASTHRSAGDHRPGESLQLSAWARPRPAAVGDTLTVGASLRNVGPFGLTSAEIAFVLPAGLRPLPGTGFVEDGSGRHPATMTSTATGVSWDLGTIETKAAATLSFKAAVGPDAQPGEGEIRALASAAFGRITVRSGEVSIPLVIERWAGSSSGAIVGRVFTDRNADGRMGEGDQPARGTVLAVDAARATRSDGNGGFAIEGLRPGDYVLQVAEASLPPGWRPLSTTVPVSIAPGETARVDIPLHRADDAPDPGEGGSLVLSGSGILKAEASPGYTSWKVQGQVEANSQGGFGLSLQGESSATHITGRAALAAPLGKNARLVMELSARPEASRRPPALGVGMEVMPAYGVKLTGGYDAGGRSPWVSAAWERRLTDTLTLSAGTRISRSAPGSTRVSLAYSGQSGVTTRLAVGSAPHLAAELSCSLSLGWGLSLSLACRQPIGGTVREGQSGAAADTFVGLWYSPRGDAPLMLGVQYEPDDGKFGGSLLFTGDMPGGGAYRVDLRSSFEPRQETVSLKLGTSLPNYLDAVATLTLDGERRVDAGGTEEKLATALSCSLMLDERTTASGLLSVKRVDSASSPAPASIVTRAAAAYVDRQVAPALFLGAGGSWTRQDPGGVSVVAVDARAAYDITPAARLILGYRTTLAGTGGSPIEASRPSGPYVRLVLASGWALTAPELYDLR